MAAYSVLIPMSLVLSRVVVRQGSPMLILGRGRRRRALRQQAAAARAGEAGDLSRALPRSLYRELVFRMRDVAVEERRRLAAELATYTAAGPVRVRAAVLV